MDAARTIHALDLGCGRGRVTFKLAHNGVHVTAVDFSSELIAQLDERASRERISVSTAVADITTYEPTGYFDLIVLSFVVHLVPKEDWRAVWRLAQSAACRDGVIVFTGFDDSSVVQSFENAFLSDGPKGWRIVDDISFVAPTLAGNRFGARSIVIKRNSSSVTGTRCDASMKIARMIASSVTDDIASEPGVARERAATSVLKSTSNAPAA